MKNHFFALSFFCCVTLVQAQPAIKRSEIYLQYLSDKSILFDTSRLSIEKHDHVTDPEDA